MTDARPAAAPARVVLVRPWTDARAGGGCCSGEVRDGGPPTRLTSEDRDRAPDAPCDLHDPVGRAWRALRAALPGLDVQVVDAGNPWLPASTFAAVRRREGTLAGVRAAARSGTAGSVLLDGDRLGDLEELGPAGVVAAVRARLG